MSASADQRAYRLTSIDMLRGLAIVIMAIDHTRDYFSVSMTIDPMSDPNAGLVLALTRWITHFCVRDWSLVRLTSRSGVLISASQLTLVGV